MSSHRKDEDYWANLLQATRERLEEQQHEREEQQQPGLEELFTNAPSTPTPQLNENDVVDSINPNVIHHLHPALGEGDKHPVKKHPKRVQIARRDSSSGIRTPERVDSKSDLSAITSKIAARLQTPPSTRRRMADQTRAILELENENDSDSDSDEDEDEDEEEDETDYQPVPPFQHQIPAPIPMEPTFVGDIRQIHPVEVQEKIEIQEKTPLLPTTLHVEDGASKRTWAASLPVWIVLLCVCVSESSRGMVVPSLWPYLQSMGGSTSELGYLVGIYSAGRLAGSLGLGWWFNKRGAKEALIISLAIAVVGNFLYSLSSLFNSFVVLLLSRLITGFGTGLLSVGRAFVAEVTTTKERTKYISYVSAVQFIGFAITPGLGAALGLLPAFYIGEWKLSELNTPGLLLSILTFIVLLLAVFLFPSQSVLEKEKEKVVSAQRMLDSKVHKEELPSNVIWTGVILFIVLNAVVRGIIALIETVATPVFLDAWDDFRTEPIDPVTDTSWMLLGLGCIGLVVILATPYLTRFLKEPYLLAFSFLVMGFGAVLLIDYSKTQEGLSLVQFLFGAALIWSIGSPISQTIIIATFSKLLGTKPQGTMMGWISAAGSVGRIVLPLLSSILGTRVSLIVSAVLALLCTTTPVFFLKFRDASHRRSYYREPYAAPSIIV